MAEAAIEIRDLVKTYAAQGDAPPKQALKGVELRRARRRDLRPARPNGAGKSTLINIMAGLVMKTAGTIAIWGHDIDRDHRNAKRSIGIVPQEIVFDPFFTPVRSAREPGRDVRHRPRSAPLGGAARRGAPRRQARRLFAHAVGRDEAAPADRQGDGPLAADPRARRADRGGRRRDCAASCGSSSSQLNAEG
jgi:ABC-type sugar transport system ATPase subunit